MQYPTRAVIGSALLLMLVACERQPQGAMPAMGPQGPMPVETLTLEAKDVERIEEMPGRTVAYRKSDIRPQVDGIIIKRNFTEGAHVNAGQQLYLIDPAVYQANLQAAQAEVSRLKSAYEQATRTRKRFGLLRQKNSVSKNDYDNTVSAEAQAKATLEAAKAQLKQAEINLAYTKVEAPISGQISASTVTEGALVTARQGNALTTITQLDPIYVDITQAGSQLLQLKQTIKSGRLQSPADSGMSVSLIIDATGQTYEHQGTLEFSDVTVDETTGTVRLRAVFPNPEKVLLPGMFVRGLVNQGIFPDAFLVPQSAVMRRPDGAAYVLAVGEGNKVVSKAITIEKSQGQDWVVTAGIADGEQIITNSLQRVAPGMEVSPMPANAAQPTH